MELKIKNFEVKDVVFGEENSFKNGILTFNKDKAIKFLKDNDEHLTHVDLEIAKPGDDVRIVPVKDAVEPRYRCGQDNYFSAATTDLKRVGDGTIHALKGMSVLGVGNTYGSFGDGLIDMNGPGAKYTYYSKLINVCVVADTDEEQERYEQQKKNLAIRWASLRLAEYLGAITKNLDSNNIESYKMKDAKDRNNNLPNVVYMMQSQSQIEEPGFNTLLYGWDMNNFLPTLIHPNEMLDGCFLSGSFMPSSSNWSTYDYMNAPVIKELYSRDGVDLNFVGVIASNLNVSMEQKERSAMFCVTLAKMLNADGVIVAEEGYGNPDADFIACIDALEDAGVKTVGLTNECTGRDGKSQPLVSLSEKADAIVSCGNVSQLLRLPAMNKVIGNLEALAKHGLSGGWADDDILGSSVKEDGTIILENNSMFSGDQVIGWSTHTVSEY